MPHLTLKSVKIQNKAQSLYLYIFLKQHNINKTILVYMKDQELARQVIELGYKGSGGEVLRREEFEARKQAAEASRLSKRSQQKYVICRCFSHFKFFCICLILII